MLHQYGWHKPVDAHLVRGDMLFRRRWKLDALLIQKTLRRLGNAMSVGIGRMLPFFGDYPAQNILTDL